MPGATNARLRRARGHHSRSVARTAHLPAIFWPILSLTVAVSSIPTLPHFFHPILETLRGEPRGLGRNDIHERVANVTGLTPAQRAERTPSGVLRYRHRIGWAMTELKMAGYIHTPERGVWRIDERGKALLEASSGALDASATARIAREARAAAGASDEQPAGETSPGAPDASPEERIDTAVAELRDATTRDLLERLAGVSPPFFEQLVLDVLHAVGYGSSRSDLEHIGRPGDGGIDGVISLDRLGFEKVYVQAKRWQGSVGRPDVQAFYGALAGRRARRGVMITTSTFTREAREFAESLGETLVLVDGQNLASLMLDSSVGVTPYRTIQLCRIDGDYFEEG